MAATADPMLLLSVGVAIIVGLLVLVFLTSSRGKFSQKQAQKSVDLRADATAASADKLDGPAIRILYGTQTGTAERFSKQLCTSLRSRYNDSVLVEVIDIENYVAPVRLAKEKLVLFLMATYGDGEPTDNAAEFMTWLLKSRDEMDYESPTSPLEGVAYGVFGLGNKQYDQFCAIGKRVHKAMQDLGAKPIVRRGDGDDDDCIDDDFSSWCDDLMKGLEEHSDILGQHLGSESEAPPTFEEYEVSIAPLGTDETAPFPSTTGLDQNHPYLATITTVRQLYSPQSDRTCVHVEVDMSNAAAHYTHGDHIGFYSRNSQQSITAAAARLGLPLSTTFTLQKPDSTSMLHEPFPGPITLETALAYFADLLASPRREVLSALASIATDANEAATLRKLASPDGKSSYADYIQKPLRSLLEVLADFPSAKPGLGLFFGCIAPRLQPRMYSISSSPKKFPTSVHVTCAVVRDQMPTGRLHEGVCSTWLEACKPGHVVPVFIRHSTFKLPKEVSTPVVMVGPGTGLAPFRGFLQELAGITESGTVTGPAHLFFGCRNRNLDYLYQDELLQYVQSGVLSKLHVAFSRENTAKDYVQHHIERQGQEIWELLAKEGAVLYVCGDAKHMAKDVHKTLISLFQKYGNCTGTQAEGKVKDLVDAGRYLKDVW